MKEDKILSEIRILQSQMAINHFSQKKSSMYFFIVGLFISMISILFAIYQVINKLFLIWTIMALSGGFLIYLIIFNFNKEISRRKVINNAWKKWEDKGLSQNQIKEKIYERLYMFAK